ncbi:MAG: rhodanese-like domain-containing protein [Bacillaceae bacterium]|nr:rhodanese-like domain-containing protein [Bacillaceae bacterium]
MKKITKFMVLPFIALLLLMAGCSQENGYDNVNVEEAKELIDSGEVVVLDVRTEPEFEQGHIPGAQLYPLQQIDQWSGQLDPDQTYVVVCRSGNRSTQASEYLSEKGFKNIYNMTGGMNEWTYETDK